MPRRRRLVGSGAVTIREGRGGCLGFLPSVRRCVMKRVVVARAETGNTSARGA
jgi:hypothetical protein